MRLSEHIEVLTAWSLLLSVFATYISQAIDQLLNRS